MEAAATFLQGLALSLATIAALGPQNLHVLRTGLARRHVGATVALCIAGDALLVGGALAGAADALGRIDALAPSLAGIAALVLAGFAWRAFGDARRPPVLTGAPGPARGPALRRSLAETAAVTFGNPAVWIDTLLLVGATGAALPAELRPAFGAGALAGSGLWFCGLAYGARLASAWLARPAAWRVISLASAAVMAALSLGWAVEFQSAIVTATGG
ncbi:MAG: LysE family transporter [Piscinibacter sp.]|uniref:LysE/ArgO family amino acid transporter n=1 Tax=Piscinibacter sp. TaxID=1903157 RepID=UPI002590CD7C|nr:LysE family transporter [Piscinibacter sp.]MCW5667503.1 LysE family transporter [Piscinibacter sp.]